MSNSLQRVLLIKEDILTPSLPTTAYCGGLALHSTFGVSVTMFFPFPSRTLIHFLSIYSHHIARDALRVTYHTFYLRWRVRKGVKGGEEKEGETEEDGKE